jgi:hypothetical protein
MWEMRTNLGYLSRHQGGLFRGGSELDFEGAAKVLLENWTRPRNTFFVPPPSGRHAELDGEQTREPPAARSTVTGMVPPCSGSGRTRGG